MSSIITLTLPGDPLFTEVARQTTTSVASLLTGENHSASDETQFVHDFELAISEAFTNSVKYAGEHDTPPTVTLTFELEKRRLTVSLLDANGPFSIDTPAPDIESYPENGYGLWIIRRVMDSVTYRREGNSNIISMSKTL